MCHYIRISNVYKCKASIQHLIVEISDNRAFSYSNIIFLKFATNFPSCFHNGIR